MMTFGIEKIETFLPHRYPFLFIDRYEISEDKQTIRGLKNLSCNENFFQGHFPEKPILPGVLQIEAMLQMGGIILGERYNISDFVPYIKKLKRIKFRKPVSPGDSMLIEADTISFENNELTIKAKTIVNEETTCQGTLVIGYTKNLEKHCTRNELIPSHIDSFSIDNDKIIDISEIKNNIPHRYPFLMIDKILFCDFEKERMVGIKNVTANEPFFQGHFNHIKILPNCLLMEIAAQIGCVYSLSKPENKNKIAYFMSIDDATFYKPVLPGDQLFIDISLAGSRGRFGKAYATIYVGKEIFTECTLKFALVEKEA